MNNKISKSNILFVDDEERILQGLKRMLRPLTDRFNLFFAQSTDEALKVCDQNDIQIVCTDMKMPSKDGAILLEQIRLRSPSSIRLVLSGQAEESHVLRALPYAHQYLPKPCDAERLQKTILDISQFTEKLPNANLRKLLLSLTAIPSSKDILQEFFRLLDRPSTKVRDISEIAKLDIGIASKIIHLITSGFLRAKTSAKGLEDAISVVGLETLRRLANDFPVFYYPEDETAQLLLKNTNQIAYTVGKALEEFALSENFYEPGLAYLRGMLVLSGRALLVSEFPEQYKNSLHIMGSQSILDFERDIFGLSSLTISASITHIWGINRIFEILPKNGFQSMPNLISLIDEREKDLFSLENTVGARS